MKMSVSVQAVCLHKCVHVMLVFFLILMNLFLNLNLHMNTCVFIPISNHQFINRKNVYEHMNEHWLQP